MNRHLTLKVCAAFLSPTAVFATGSQYTGGYATDQNVTFYYTARYVTNPSLPGPEVAFNQDTGISYLNLGTHDCNGVSDGAFYQQYPGLWEPVHYYANPTIFCVMTAAVYGSGNFNGTIAWD